MTFKTLNKKPDIICIQETWLKQTLVIGGYSGVHRGRSEVHGGGCETFFYSKRKTEHIVVEVWNKNGIKIVHF